MKTEKIFTRVFTAVFLLAILVFAILCSGWKFPMYAFEYLKNGFADTKTTGDITFNSYEQEFVKNIWKKGELVSIHGSLTKLIGLRELYSGSNAYIATNNYIVSRANKTTTDFEFTSTLDFYNDLKDHGVNLIYVNEPVKYLDDEFFFEQFGKDNFMNQNTDLLLSRFREAGIPCIDLRDNIREEGLDSFSMFFRTDIHWTVQSGLWAANIIAKGLNEYAGYNIDTSIYDPEKYDYVEYHECWIGELGRKVGKGAIGLDDFTKVTPAFETSFTIMRDDLDPYDGDFSLFYRDTVFDTEKDIYESGYWNYGYLTRHSFNHNVSEGSVLVVGDSYETVLIPFMALGVHEIDYINLRNVDSDFDLRTYVYENGFDTVVIAYAQRSIGKHDTPKDTSAMMYAF